MSVPDEERIGFRASVTIADIQRGQGYANQPCVVEPGYGISPIGGDGLRRPLECGRSRGVQIVIVKPEYDLLVVFGIAAGVGRSQLVL